MPERDTNIGYPETETVEVSITTTVTSDELLALVDSGDATLAELKRIRSASEFILGQEVEVND